MVERIVSNRHYSRIEDHIPHHHPVGGKASSGGGGKMPSGNLPLYVQEVREILGYKYQKDFARRAGLPEGTSKVIDSPFGESLSSTSADKIADALGDLPEGHPAGEGVIQYLLYRSLDRNGRRIVRELLIPFDAYERPDPSALEAERLKSREEARLRAEETAVSLGDPENVRILRELKITKAERALHKRLEEIDLTPLQLEAITLLCVHGLTKEDIAHRQGTARSVAHRKIDAARKKIESVLGTDVLREVDEANIEGFGTIRIPREEPDTTTDKEVAHTSLTGMGLTSLQAEAVYLSSKGLTIQEIATKLGTSRVAVHSRLSIGRQRVGDMQGQVVLTKVLQGEYHDLGEVTSTRQQQFCKDEETEDSEISRNLLTAAGLSSAQVNAVYFRGKGLTLQEIATKLGIPRDSVGSHLSLGRQRLEDLLGEEVREEVINGNLSVLEGRVNTEEHALSEAKASELLEKLQDHGVPEYHAKVMVLKGRGLSNETIADILGVSVDEAKVKFTRARSFVQVHLGSDYITEVMGTPDARKKIPVPSGVHVDESNLSSTQKRLAESGISHADIAAMKWTQGLSMPEIAQHLGVPTALIRNRYTVAYRGFVSKFGKEGVEDVRAGKWEEDEFTPKKIATTESHEKDSTSIGSAEIPDQERISTAQGVDEIDDTITEEELVVDFSNRLEDDTTPAPDFRYDEPTCNLNDGIGEPQRNHDEPDEAEPHDPHDER